MTEARSLQAADKPVEITLPARRTPVYRSVDVLVCGGGLAGVAAAVAAARAGSDTLLVERNVVLGGNGPLAFDIGLTEGSGGISAEIFERLRASGNAAADETAGGALIYDPEALKYACLDLVREAGGHLLLATWVSDPILDDGAVRGAMVENKSGRFAVRAKVVIDATGDADLAVRAGAAVREPGETPLGINARVGGIDFDRALAGSAHWPALVAEAKRAGRLDPRQPDTIALYGITPLARERGIAFVAGPRFGGRQAWNSRDLSVSETEGRKLMRAFLAFLKTVPGFEESFLVDVAGTLALTHSRHVAGDATLADGAPGAAVPFGCLLPQGVDNLLVAGRAASFDPDFYARSGAGIDCAALGDAAGRAAAEAVRSGVTPRDLEAAAA
ncbi:FAD-dependent oxidoreductase [Sphingomonas canadensis]|uniref:FAD-dependent oxidoreductase n=1 Tax=Sphingomonas canadensis TaxID=1219257 RepID=A0ABW3H8U0_9SPHN|nr:FAD-dependent oxidoreductase [Sphingomonas canadensis]MCW3837628.1 FAD-dependent oxidoreductase [Sphingomonas canadensis]